MRTYLECPNSNQPIALVWLGSKSHKITIETNKASSLLKNVSSSTAGIVCLYSTSAICFELSRLPAIENPAHKHK